VVVLHLLASLALLKGWRLLWVTGDSAPWARQQYQQGTPLCWKPLQLLLAGEASAEASAGAVV